MSPHPPRRIAVEITCVGPPTRTPTGIPELPVGGAHIASASKHSRAAQYGTSRACDVTHIARGVDMRKVSHNAGHVRGEAGSIAGESVRVAIEERQRYADPVAAVLQPRAGRLPVRACLSHRRGATE
jgi:hypothetical protein